MRYILLALLWGVGLGPRASEDVATLLDRYREETIERPVFLEGGTRTETSQTLENIGPNVLPILAEFIEREGDQRVRRELTGLFQRISGFRQYRYVQDPAKSAGRFPVESDSGSLPILSRNVAAGNEPTETANQLLTWWSLRHTFLKRDNSCGRLREITGASLDEWLSYDMKRATRLDKEFSVYGIYNLPDYVSLIAEDNNPVLYMDFLASCRRFQEYTGHGFHKITSFARVKAVQDEYPTIEAKMAVVCTWWKEKKHTFTELADLYEAIDEVVGKHCPQD